MRNGIIDETLEALSNLEMCLLTRNSNEAYLLTIRNAMRFAMVVSIVRSEKSFRRAQESMRLAREGKLPISERSNRAPCLPVCTKSYFSKFAIDKSACV